MTDYKELVQELRGLSLDYGEQDSLNTILYLAANAIEDLITNLTASNEVIAKYRGQMPKWIPFETRPMDEEERQYYSEHYGHELTDDEAIIYCSKLPEHGQEVLVCSMYGHIWIDTFDDDPDYGVGFEENGDMDGLVAWMPLPKPPKGGE